jgi:hypothetical protein
MKPDLILRYPQKENGFCEPGQAFNACDDRTAYAVIYLRPETNRVLYEKAILSCVRACGETLYLANLNGGLFTRDRILESHYASQFRFIDAPLQELERFPPIAARFQEHFHVAVHDARIIGSFQAVGALGLSEEDLMETVVPETDFLDCWGQTFKKIAGAFVVNPNLPAIVKRTTLESNIFVLAVRAREGSPRFFDELNRAIFTYVSTCKETPVIDGEKLGSLAWSERIRRTYHISTNHVMAMFDMADFVYTSETTRLGVADTPLGSWLVASGATDPEGLTRLKEEHLCLVAGTDGESLEYLPRSADGLSLAEVGALFRRADSRLR